MKKPLKRNNKNFSINSGKKKRIMLFAFVLLIISLVGV